MLSVVLARFSRISSQRLIPEVDGLRFVAIAGVLLTHLVGFGLRYGHAWAYAIHHSPLGALIARGSYGVMLFFAISGFILTLPFASSYLAGGTARPTLRSYFRRRLTRLEPLYLLVMLASALGLVSLHVGLVPLSHALASLVYAHTLIFGTIPLVNPVTWSLEVEVQFYILVPLVVTVFALRPALRRSILIASVVADAALVAWYADPAGWDRLRLSIAGQWSYFAVGILLADLYLTAWSERGATARGRRPEPAVSRRVRSLGWDAVLLPLPLLALSTEWRAYHLDAFAMPLVVFLIFTAALRGVVLRRMITAPVIPTIGGGAYSIYLVHHHTLLAVCKFTPFGILTIPLALVAVLVVSALTFLLVERPTMRPDWPTRLAMKFFEVRRAVLLRAHA